MARGVNIGIQTGYKRSGNRRGVNISLEGGESLMNVLDRIGDSVERDVAIQVANAAYEIHAGALERVRIDTGNLAESLDVRFYDGGQTATVSTNVLYAPPVESKYPFIVPPFKTARADFMRRVRNIVRRDIRGGR